MGKIVSTMEQRHRCKGISLLAIVIVTLLIPTQATSENSVFYVESMHIEDAQAGKKTIELDDDGNIYASFGNTLYKFDAMGNILSEQTFAAEILATSISPDSHDWHSQYEEVQLGRIQHSSSRVEILVPWFQVLLPQAMRICWIGPKRSQHFHEWARARFDSTSRDTSR